MDEYRIEIWLRGNKVQSHNGTLEEILNWYKEKWQDKYEADEDGVWFQVYDSNWKCLSYNDKVNAGFFLK